MKPKHIKKVLMSEINKVANNPKDYCFHPDTDFTRKRKISMKAVLTGIIGMGSGSLTNELIDFFHASPQMPTPSAFYSREVRLSLKLSVPYWTALTKQLRKVFQKRCLYLLLTVQTFKLLQTLGILDHIILEATDKKDIIFYI